MSSFKAFSMFFIIFIIIFCGLCIVAFGWRNVGIKEFEDLETRVAFLEAILDVERGLVIPN